LASARSAGIPVLDSTRPSADIAQLLADAESMEFPLFVKAVAGGGGRGMRRVGQSSDLEDALKAAMREAEGAFGDPTVCIEQAEQRPRHTEVPVPPDTNSHAIQLFAPACSVQRRHRRTAGIALTPNMGTAIA